MTRTLCAALLLTALAVPALAQTSAASPTQQAFDRAMAEVKAGRLQNALVILEPYRKNPQAEGPLLSLLGTLYIETGRPTEAMAVLEPLTQRPNPEAAVLYQAGRAAALLGQREKAEAWLVAAAELAPTSPAAREVGMLRAAQDRPTEALALLWPWLQAEPSDAQAALAAAQAAARLGELEMATAASALLPAEAPTTKLVQAEIALAKSDAPAALALLKPILNGPPGPYDKAARGFAAEAYFLQEDGAGVVKVLAGKTEKDPQLSLLLARALRQTGKLGDAVNTLKPLAEQVLSAPNVNRVAPFAGALLLEYGRTLVASGRSREAGVALERATALNPASLQAWQALAEALTSLGEPTKASAARARAQQLIDAQRQAFGQAGESGEGKAAMLGPVMDALVGGEPEKALGLARAEAQRVPQDPRPQLLEVRILISLGRSEDALRSAEGAAGRFPNLPDAIYQRGALRMARGDTAGAEADLRQALTMRPDHPAAMNDLAVLLMTRKQFGEAKKLLERVLALNPQDALAAQNLKSLPPGT